MNRIQMLKKVNMEKEFLKMMVDHQNIIHKVCRIYRNTIEDQEDLFQEIIFQLWKSYPNFRSQSKVSTWMYRIALNTALSSFRKHLPQVDYTEEIPEKTDFIYEQAATENEEKLFDAIRKLNDAEKAIISLYLEDYSYREISEIIGISESNVGVRINRIKSKLINILN